MQTVDLNPLYRTLVGFDRISTLMDQAARLDAGQGYPPFNIERVGDDTFRIELAVAGFTQDDLTIETRDGLLIVTGRKQENAAQERKWLHRGIAERAFERRFQLADHVIVTGAAIEHGLLRVELERRLPEALKPRRIAIGTGSAASKPTTHDGQVLDATGVDPAPVLEGAKPERAKAGGTKAV